MHEPEWSVAPLEPFNWAPRAGAASSQAPDVSDLRERSHFEHNAHMVLEAAHVVGTIAEFYEIIHVSGAPLVAAHGGVAAAAAWIAPIGGIATVVTAFLELHKAFTTTQRIESQKGVSYGLMWEVLGMPDAAHTTRPAPIGDGSIPLTKSEREAFEEGVREGREKAQDPAVREAIVKALSYEMAAQGRNLDTDPQHHAWHKAVDNTLNRIWDGAHEDLGPLKGSRIPWEGQQDGFPKTAP